MFRGAFTAVALLLSVSAPAFSDVSLDDAVALWLTGDDETSLPALAALAQDGNAQARVLLARIETTDLGVSPFRQSLTAEQRRKLFRYAPEAARFPRSWLLIEAMEGNELAALLSASRRPIIDLQMHAALWEAGEHQATRYSTRLIALRGSASAREAISSKGMILPELEPFWSEVTVNAPGARGTAILARMTGKTDFDLDDPDTVEMMRALSMGLGPDGLNPDNQWQAQVSDWLLSDDPLRPIADLCRQSCPAQAGQCALTLLVLSGGYAEATEIDSPYETLISQDRFLSSSRARLMALRRAAFARSAGRPYSRDNIAELSSCTADLIAQERAKY